MDARRRPGRGAALPAAFLLLFQGCTTILKGTHQKIPVTSAPAGARVLVDGRPAGTTPLILKLRKKAPAVIRIEKEGYDPCEIRVIRDKTATATEATIGRNLTLVLFSGILILWPVMIMDETHDFRVVLPASLALSTAALIGIDFATGAPYSLTPESLDVPLTPTGRDPRIDVIRIEEARLKNVKWLRVRATEGR